MDKGLSIQQSQHRGVFHFQESRTTSLHFVASPQNKAKQMRNPAESSPAAETSRLLTPCFTSLQICGKLSAQGMDIVQLDHFCDQRHQNPAFSVLGTIMLHQDGHQPLAMAAAIEQHGVSPLKRELSSISHLWQRQAMLGFGV
jgi:hypothetical protein